MYHMVGGWTAIHATISDRLVKPNLARRCSTGVSPVCWEITSRVAISMLVRPWATRSATSRSRRVSGSRCRSVVEWFGVVRPERGRARRRVGGPGFGEPGMGKGAFLSEARLPLPENCEATTQLGGVWVGRPAHPFDLRICARYDETVRIRDLLAFQQISTLHFSGVMTGALCIGSAGEIIAGIGWDVVVTDWRSTDLP